MTRVRAWADDRVITISYDPTGLAWAQLTEHHVESWNVYETSDPEEDRSLCHPLGAPQVQAVASENQGGTRLV